MARASAVSTGIAPRSQGAHLADRAGSHGTTHTSRRLPICREVKMIDPPSAFERPEASPRLAESRTTSVMAARQFSQLDAQWCGRRAVTLEHGTLSAQPTSPESRRVMINPSGKARCPTYCGRRLMTTRRHTVCQADADPRLPIAGLSTAGFP